MIQQYLQLGKFRLSLLVVFTCGIGYSLGTSEFDLGLANNLLAGTLLCAMGANGLNQWWERDFDAKMRRTCRRPIPSGKISTTIALLVSIIWSLAGLMLLYLFVNTLTACLAAITTSIYILVYTPLKRVSPIAILAGAIPGAIPPMMGWTAATAELNAQAWVLFFILYLWQIPHFMSLATLYRQDYIQGGYKLMSADPMFDSSTRSIVLVFCIALLSISLLAPYVGLGQWLYFLGAAATGFYLLFFAVRFYFCNDSQNAKRLFVSSIIYLPTLFSILLYDHMFLFPGL